MNPSRGEPTVPEKGKNPFFKAFLANIRREPRFQKLMERVKYEWEHFEV